MNDKGVSNYFWIDQLTFHAVGVCVCVCMCVRARAKTDAFRISHPIK